MQKKILYLILFFFSNNAFPHANLVDTYHGYSTIEMLNSGIPDTLRMISVQDLEKELKGKPAMAVGFDIDDTVLFSSPIFYRAEQELAFAKKPGKNDQKYWDKINCGWDAFSIPKEIARKLIKMHNTRGDSIFFITGRKASKCDFVEKYLSKKFSIPNMNKVIFTGASGVNFPKAKEIMKNRIKIYYGDSDIDIISARIAGAEGIRIMRAANSTYRPIPKNGKYNERILIDSDR